MALSMARSALINACAISKPLKFFLGAKMNAQVPEAFKAAFSRGL